MFPQLLTRSFPFLLSKVVERPQELLCSNVTDEKLQLCGGLGIVTSSALKFWLPFYDSISPQTLGFQLGQAVLKVGLYNQPRFTNKAEGPRRPLPLERKWS